MSKSDLFRFRQKKGIWPVSTFRVKRSCTKIIYIIYDQIDSYISIRFSKVGLIPTGPRRLGLCYYIYVLTYHVPSNRQTTSFFFNWVGQIENDILFYFGCLEVTSVSTRYDTTGDNLCFCIFSTHTFWSTVPSCDRKTFFRNYKEL